jgi:hypothetical protein
MPSWRGAHLKAQGQLYTYLTLPAINRRQSFESGYSIKTKNNLICSVGFLKHVSKAEAFPSHRFMNLAPSHPSYALKVVIYGY